MGQLSSNSPQNLIQWSQSSKGWVKTKLVRNLTKLSGPEEALLALNLGFNGPLLHATIPEDNI